MDLTYLSSIIFCLFLPTPTLISTPLNDLLFMSKIFICLHLQVYASATYSTPEVLPSLTAGQILFILQNPAERSIPFIHFSVCSLQKFLLSGYSMPGTLLGAGRAPLWLYGMCSYNFLYKSLLNYLSHCNLTFSLAGCFPLLNSEQLENKICLIHLCKLKIQPIEGI